MTRLGRVNAFVKEATGKGIYREMVVKEIACDKHHGQTDVLVFDDLGCHAYQLFDLLKAFDVELNKVLMNAWEDRLRIFLPEGTLDKNGLGEYL
jgi:hypothetical protein